MADHFFDHPILNSPYDYPARHWELDESGQPTDRIIETCRHLDLITSVPKPNTTVINSEQIKFSEALDKDFRDMAADEIDCFCPNIVKRTGDIRPVGDHTDQDLPREVLNTAGKADWLGESLYCVASVLMLTDKCDARPRCIS